jgi:hypothetical protein
MSKFVVVGFPGSDAVWLADIDNGTIRPINPAPSPQLDTVNQIRAAGGTLTKDVNLAIAVESADSAFSGLFDV